MVYCSVYSIFCRESCRTWFTTLHLTFILRGLVSPVPCDDHNPFERTASASSLPPTFISDAGHVTRENALPEANVRDRASRDTRHLERKLWPYSLPCCSVTFARSRQPGDREPHSGHNYHLLFPCASICLPPVAFQRRRETARRESLENLVTWPDHPVTWRAWPGKTPQTSIGTLRLQVMVTDTGHWHHSSSYYLFSMGTRGKTPPRPRPPHE